MASELNESHEDKLKREREDMIALKRRLVE